MKTKLISLTCLLIVLLQACQASAQVQNTLPPQPSATFAPTATQTLPPSPTATITPTPLPRAARVLIISIDGLRPDAIALAPMPNLLAHMQNSAYTLSALTVQPSVTLVAHASMLIGVCPTKHGVDWNEYIPENGFAKGIDLFDLAHANRFQTVMYVGKDKMRQLTEPASTDIFAYINEHDLILTEQLLANFPQDFGVMFVHLPSTDWLGHDYGWLSEKQLEYIRYADVALGQIFAELDARGLRDETLIIITADHGGHETRHNIGLPEDLAIPWIIAGPGVKPQQLKTQVHIMDTAATAAFMLGMFIPADWDGVPIYEAFGLPIVKTSTNCQ